MASYATVRNQDPECSPDHRLRARKCPIIPDEIVPHPVLLDGRPLLAVTFVSLYASPSVRRNAEWYCGAAIARPLAFYPAAVRRENEAGSAGWRRSGRVNSPALQVDDH